MKCARKRLAPPTAASLEARVCGLVPAAARDLVGEGVRRLVAYQDATYAQLYLEPGTYSRRRPIGSAGGRLLRQTARHRAIHMSFEDVIRLAPAKIDPARFQRIAEEMGSRQARPLRSLSSSNPASRRSPRSCRRFWPGRSWR